MNSVGASQGPEVSLQALANDSSVGQWKLARADVFEALNNGQVNTYVGLREIVVDGAIVSVDRLCGDPSSQTVGSFSTKIPSVLSIQNQKVMATKVVQAYVESDGPTLTSKKVDSSDISEEMTFPEREGTKHRVTGIDANTLEIWSYFTSSDGTGEFAYRATYTKQP